MNHGWQCVVSEISMLNRFFAGWTDRNGSGVIPTMKPVRVLFPTLLVIGFCGCASSGGRERGPDGTVAYSVHVESSDPGARVEVNDDCVGVTPLDVKVFGDRDGTFHNFGTSDFVIRVHPVRQGQNVQSKTFRTGGWFGQEDRIPSRLFFDLNLKSEGFTVEPSKPRF